MSLVKSFTANGVLAGKQNVVFGISASSMIPQPPPTGALAVVVRDDAATGGTGTILARIVISELGGSGSVMFPAGVRCTNGVAVTLTQPSGGGAVAHDDVVVTIDYS